MSNAPAKNDQKKPEAQKSIGKAVGVVEMDGKYLVMEVPIYDSGTHTIITETASSIAAGAAMRLYLMREFQTIVGRAHVPPTA